MKSRFFNILSIIFICSVFALPSSVSTQSNSFYMQQQMIRQQQMMQQQQQQQQQQQMMRQQQEQMRRQQEQMRQQQMQQQQMQRQMQQQQQEAMRQRQQEVQSQRQRQLDKQRQRQLEEQQRSKNQQNQITQQKKALQQQQVLQQQRQIKDRKDRLHQLQQERLRKQQKDKKKRESDNSLTMAALLLQQARPNSTTSPLKPQNQKQSVNQFQQKRLHQQKQQRATKQLETQRKTAHARMQKIRAAQKQLQSKKLAAKKQQQKFTRTQKLAQANFGSCIGEMCSTCSFHGDTQVLTRNGYEAIKSLTVGDYVWARNEYTGNSDWKTVTAHYSNLYEETVAVTTRSLPDGKTQTILSNRIHPFYVSDLGVHHKETELVDVKKDINKAGQWVQAQALKPGNLLLTDSNHSAEVVSIDIKGESLKAYNVTVDEYHTYFVKSARADKSPSVWVHNDCGQEGRSSRNVVSRIKENSRLIKESEITGRSHQQSIDKLVSQLKSGNLNPGIGTKPIGRGLSEARSRDGARVYFKMSNNDIEILGKSNKNNQQIVIKEVLKTFGN